MEIIYLSKAEKDLEFWIRAGDKRMLKKIAQLTEDIVKNPFEGIGKPEALRYNLTGKWSRRISQEHRFIYSIIGGTLFIYSLKDHYM